MLKKMIIICSLLIVGIATTSEASDYLWSCDINYKNEYIGRYVFEIDAEDGTETTLKRLLSDLQKFCPVAKLKKGRQYFASTDSGNIIAYRKVSVGRNILIVTRPLVDNRSVTVKLTLKDNLLRKVLYPIEPTADNDWSGWPTK